MTASNKAQVLPVGITMIESPYWLIMARGGGCRPFGQSLIGARSVVGNRWLTILVLRVPGQLNRRSANRYVITATIKADVRG